jgi:hypothetical protein
MLDGFWVVQFAGMEGKGGGVAVFMNGKIFGGDSAFTYLGSYTENGDRVSAEVLVQNFDAQIDNVLGIKGDFTLNFDMVRKADDQLEGQASTPAAPGFGLKARLRRRSLLK